MPKTLHTHHFSEGGTQCDKDGCELLRGPNNAPNPFPESPSPKKQSVPKNLQQLIEEAKREMDDHYKKEQKFSGKYLLAFLEAQMRLAYREGAEGMREAINLENIKTWPPPVEGAGKGLGALAGTGMYMQYDSDCKKHTQQIEEAERKAEAFLATLNPPNL